MPARPREANASTCTGDRRIGTDRRAFPTGSASSSFSSAVGHLIMSSSVRSSKNAVAASISSTSSSNLRTEAGEIRYPAGDDHLAPAQPRQQFLDYGSGFGVIDIIEDHQPAGMIFESADRGGNFHFVLARVSAIGAAPRRAPIFVFDQPGAESPIERAQFRKARPVSLVSSIARVPAPGHSFAGVLQHYLTLVP